MNRQNDRQAELKTLPSCKFIGRGCGGGWRGPYMGKGAGARWVPKWTSLNMSRWGLIWPLPTNDIISSGHMETPGNWQNDTHDWKHYLPAKNLMSGRQRHLKLQKIISNISISRPKYTDVYESIIHTRMHSSRMRTGRSLTVCREGCMVPGVCVCLVEGGCMVLGGVCTWSGGVVPGPGGVVSQHALRQTPPVNRIKHTSKNITWATTSLRPVIILFWGTNLGLNYN